MWGVMAATEPSRAEIGHAITELLRGEEIATLATLASDGSPSASVMHIAADGFKVYMHTFVRTRKYGEMLANPKVSYAASHLPPGGYDERELTRSLQVKGRATLVTDQGEIEHAIQLSLAQFAWAAGTSLFTNVKPPGEGQQVFFRIDPDQAVWADNRVRMMWRVIVNFHEDSSHITAVRPYHAASAARR
jgi:general stress protein 26